MQITQFNISNTKLNLRGNFYNMFARRFPSSLSDHIQRGPVNYIQYETEYNIYILNEDSNTLIFLVFVLKYESLQYITQV